MRRVWFCGWTLAALAGCAETVSGVGDRAGAACPGAIDGNAAGARGGPQTVLYVTPAQWTRGLPLPDATACGAGGGGHQLLVRYVPRGDGYLTVTLSGRGSAGDIDPPVVGRLLLLDGCGAGARRLACEGRDARFGPLSDQPAPLTSPARVTAGRAVYVAATGDAAEAEVTITEVATVRALGARCDPALRNDRCADGGTCVGAPRGQCVPDGAEGARCRRAGAACEPGLSCFFATRDGSPGRCLRRVAPGERCDVGAPCLEGACGPAGRCRDYGVADGPCRDAEPRCGPGLACATGGARDVWRCRRATPVGERCTSRLADTVCAQGASCIEVGDALRCVRVGAVGGDCRVAPPRCAAGLTCARGTQRCVAAAPPAGVGAPCDGTPGACADGLRCDGGRCAPPAAIGAPCAPDTEPQCVAGAACVHVGAASGARCVADGARGGVCRASAPPCDAALACVVGRRCAPTVAVGARCAAGEACVGGARCADTCRAAGSEAGWCRLAAPRCDVGLVCVTGSPAPPRCARALALGDPCSLDDEAGEACPEGAECVSRGDDGRLRCAPRAAAVLCTADAGGPAACPPATVCARGLCLAGSPAGGRCDDATPCARGAVCAQGLEAACVAEGAHGAPCRVEGPPCSDGHECFPQGGVSLCQAVVRAGEACPGVSGARCAAGLTCVDQACRADGGPGARCRRGEAPCDPGLVCDGALCRAPAARGARCDASNPCDGALACAAVRGEPARCGDGAYATSLRPGAPSEDVCQLPVRSLTTPMTVRLFGVAYEVAVGPDGAAHLLRPPLRAEGAVEASLRGPPGVIPLDDPRSRRACARVVGEAPRRRLVYGGLGGDDDAGGELSVHEGSGVVEFLLRGSSEGGGVSSARVELSVAGYERFTSPPFPNVPGTAVTLTPR